MAETGEVCLVGNITPRGRQRRLLHAAAMALVVLAGLYVIGPGWGRALLFFPAVIAAASFGQAYKKT